MIHARHFMIAEYESGSVVLNLSTGRVFLASPESAPVVLAFARGATAGALEKVCAEEWSVPRYVAREQVRALAQLESATPTTTNLSARGIPLFEPIGLVHVHHLSEVSLERGLPALAVAAGNDAPILLCDPPEDVAARAVRTNLFTRDSQSDPVPKLRWTGPHFKQIWFAIHSSSNVLRLASLASHRAAAKLLLCLRSEHGPLEVSSFFHAVSDLVRNVACFDVIFPNGREAREEVFSFLSGETRAHESLSVSVAGGAR